MDYQKDTPKTEGLIKFVDAQATKTNPFGENRVGERAYRRAERISAAIFLMTSHVSDTEPLRSRARNLALDLIEDVLAVRDELRSLNSPRASKLKTSIRELISITRMLAVGGMTSFQNSSVLCEALDELSGFLVASQRSTLSESVSYAREDFLDTREVATQTASKPVVRDASDVSVGTEKDVRPAARNGESEKQAVGNGHIKNTGNGRSQAILEVLRVGGELGIRDVASNLPEFSEKMIQRELAVLVQKGLVSKKGLKRWSRYSLKA